MGGQVYCAESQWGGEGYLGGLNTDKHLIILVASLASLVLLGGAVAAAVVEDGNLGRIEVGRHEGLGLGHNGGALGALRRGGVGGQEGSHDSRSRTRGDHLTAIHLHGHTSGAEARLQNTPLKRVSFRMTAFKQRLEA